MQDGERLLAERMVIAISIYTLLVGSTLSPYHPPSTYLTAPTHCLDRLLARVWTFCRRASPMAPRLASILTTILQLSVGLLTKNLTATIHSKTSIPANYSTLQVAAITLAQDCKPTAITQPVRSVGQLYPIITAFHCSTSALV